MTQRIARLWASFQTHSPLLALLVIATTLRAFRLGHPSGALIGDEVYYVQDARVILGLPVMFHHLPGSAASYLDPNPEHPPLAKLIMAGFIHVFGDKDFAWRIPSVVLGTLSIWVLYLIVRELGGSARQALFAAFVLAFDNLSFVHGRIAMLDIYMTTFCLVGTLLYFRSYFELAGVAFAIATLCKLNGLLGVGALVLYELLRTPRWSFWPVVRALRPCAVTGGFCVAFLLLGLGALDCYVTTYRNPLEHIAYMVSYAKSLTRTGPPQGSESTPLQWWVNSGVINYFVVTTSVPGGTWTSVLFRAAMTDVVIFSAPLALYYAMKRTWAGTSRIAAFAIASLVANYAPVFAAWAIVHRMSYIYYMVPSMPAIVCAITLAATKLPRYFQWCFVAAMLYGFVFSFPFHYF
ncbi:MAG: glycosyltransferase family 39 protein [Polyangiaceae bacterium]|nr:glycosyltransferase family 39 protein [Polyangiaceae bacterium]